MQIGRLSFDPSTHEVSVGGKPLSLPRRELALLALLPPAGNVPWRGRSDGVWTHSSARSGTGRSAFMASSSHQMAGGGDAMQSIPCF